MRFSAALEHIATLRRQSAAAGQQPFEPALANPTMNPPASQTAAKPRPELPVDLDQRVRLIGEW